MLQRRAGAKVTFPLCWTNTCCSHPLHTDEEMGRTAGAADDATGGCRVAAVRKLEQELGMAVAADDLRYLTRIHYRADSDTMWGEHEIDYIFFTQGDVPFAPNPNEVEPDDEWGGIRFVDPDQLKAMLQDPQHTFTPWSRMIIDEFLFEWWDRVRGPRGLQGLVVSDADRDTIHRLQGAVV